MRLRERPRGGEAGARGVERGGKARDEVVRGAALEPYLGRRARKGRRQDTIPKATRVVAADAG